MTVPERALHSDPPRRALEVVAPAGPEATVRIAQPQTIWNVRRLERTDAASVKGRTRSRCACSPWWPCAHQPMDDPGAVSAGRGSEPGPTCTRCRGPGPGDRSAMELTDNSPPVDQAAIRTSVPARNQAIGRPGTAATLRPAPIRTDGRRCLTRTPARAIRPWWPPALTGQCVNTAS